MGFAYYKKCTIQTGQVPSSQSSFPVVMPFLGGDSDFATTANGGKATSSSGFDIRPFSDQYLTTALTFELVTNSYSATTGAFEMWVNMTAVDGGVVYMAVGDPTVTTDGSSNTTWNSAFLCVYHLGTSTTLSLSDSTSNGNTLTNNNSATATSGKIGGAVSLAQASSQFLKTGNFTGAQQMTMSGWINGTSFPDSYNTPYAFDSNFNMYITSAPKTAVYVNSTVGTTFYDPGTTTLSTSTWYHFAASYDNTNGLVGYLNAASDGTAAINGNLTIATTDFDIGQDPAFSGRIWNGLIDEVHMSNVTRSANWITTEYNNQNAPGTFWGKGTITPNMFGSITS